MPDIPYSAGRAAYVPHHVDPKPHLCPADSVRISATEQRICAGVANGLSNREIALDVGLSRHTVRGHLVSLFVKLGVRNRAQLAVMALRAGLLK